MPAGQSLRIILTVQHPADVHFFKHAIDELEAAGHEVHVFVRENEVAVDLLEQYGIAHTVLVSESASLARLTVTQARYGFRLWRAARRLEPDVMAAVGGVTVSHVGALVGARSIAFTDTEHATVVNRLAFPFADTVCTPACYFDEIGTKHLTYRGTQELAYLHPDRFAPDDAVLEELGLSGDDAVVVLRVSAWNSSHDIGQHGFTDIPHVVETIEALGARVVVSSEIDLPPGVTDRDLRLPPHRMHDLLAAADLYIGEGATMAAESAILGTPSVYVNSLSMGYIDLLANRYGLLAQFNREPRALAYAERLLARGSKMARSHKREELFAETVDVTDVIVAVIEGATNFRDHGQSPPVSDLDEQKIPETGDSAAVRSRIR